MPTYDTAGSAKMLKEDKNLPEGCTKENTAAIGEWVCCVFYFYFLCWIGFCSVV